MGTGMMPPMQRRRHPSITSHLFHLPQAANLARLAHMTPAEVEAATREALSFLSPEAVAQVAFDCIAGRRDADRGKAIALPSP